MHMEIIYNLITYHIYSWCCVLLFHVYENCHNQLAYLSPRKTLHLVQGGMLGFKSVDAHYQNEINHIYQNNNLFSHEYFLWSYILD